MERSVRKLAVAGGLTLTELPERNHCCGFGGHMRTADQRLFDTIVDRRVSADEAPYLVYCANCAGSFSLAGKAHSHILDMVFPAPDDVTESGASLQRQRDNAISAKADLMELYNGGSFEPTARPWDTLRVNIPASLIADMNRRLILADDVKEAIYEAEQAGEVFILLGGASDGDNLRQCCLVRDVITTWVQYVKRAESKTCDYSVVDVWNHRMSFSGAD